MLSYMFLYWFKLIYTQNEYKKFNFQCFKQNIYNFHNMYKCYMCFEWKVVNFVIFQTILPKQCFTLLNREIYFRFRIWVIVNAWCKGFYLLNIRIQSIGLWLITVRHKKLQFVTILLLITFATILLLILRLRCDCFATY